MPLLPRANRVARQEFNAKNILWFVEIFQLKGKQLLRAFKEVQPARGAEPSVLKLYSKNVIISRCQAFPGDAVTFTGSDDSRLKLKHWSNFNSATRISGS